MSLGLNHRFFKEEHRRPINQVRRPSGNAVRVAGETEGSAVPLQLQLIKNRYRVEKSLQVMKSVRTGTQNIQYQIDLAGAGV